MSRFAALIVLTLLVTFAVVFTGCSDEEDKGLSNETRAFELGDSGVMIEMIWIPAGSFRMGAQYYEPDARTAEYPRHRVTISEGFWIGKYEVTQEQWIAVAGNKLFQWPDSPNRPAERVSYDELHEEFLSQLGNEWRLPTEAEWEYACRAGIDDEWFFWGSDYSDLDDYCWYIENSHDSLFVVG